MKGPQRKLRAGLGLGRRFSQFKQIEARYCEHHNLNLARWAVRRSVVIMCLPQRHTGYLGVIEGQLGVFHRGYQQR
jgi:hypothetical protein